MKSFVVFFLLSSTLFAATSVVIPPNPPDNDTTTISDEGDTVTIESNGVINNTSNNGIVATGANQVITNGGSISTTTGDGIRSSGADLSIINSGVITASGGGAGSNCILLTGANSTIVNYGTITAQGEGQSTKVGIVLFSTASGANVSNHGLISATGDNGSAILVQSPNTTVTNTGTISSSSSTGKGIEASGVSSNMHVINSGTIRSTQDVSIQFVSSNPQLTLLRDSRIEGMVRTSSDLLNLSVEEGLNLRLTITDDSVGFGRLNIDDPYAIITNTHTIAVVDKTGLALQSDVLEDLSDAVLDTIYRRRLPYLLCHTPACGAWAEGIGTYRERSNQIAYHTWEGGGIAGIDMPAWCTSTWGLFGGGTHGKADIEGNTQQADISTAFGGLNFQQLAGRLFWGSTFTAGWVNWENERTIMNNVAPGGVQQAHVDTHGFFLFPEIYGAGWLAKTNSWGVVGSATFRYAGLFLGNYTESGSGANLTVNDRTINLLKLRGELAAPIMHTLGCFHLELEPYIGVAGRFQVSGIGVDAELLGQNIYFSTGDPRNLGELLVGLRGEETYGRQTLFFNFQGLFDSHQGKRILGEVGLNYSF